MDHRRELSPRYATKDNGKWAPFPKEQTIEYRLARWIADRNPTGRVFAFGGLCFRLNSWFDVPQVGGEVLNPD